MSDRTQWLRGLTDVLVLRTLEDGRSYGYELVEHFVAAGLDDLNEATVYGALRRLEAAGLLRSSLERSTSGPARKYYELTATGRRVAAQRLAEWTTFRQAVDALLAPQRQTKRSTAS